jgi:flagellar M-ring protein FliF
MAVVPFNSDRLSDLKARTSRLLSGFSAGQKAIVLLGSAAVVIAGAFFVHSESSPSYQVLYSGLSAKDAGAITAKLSAAKVPYRLAAGGSEILVPAAQVDQERVAMAEAGLPSSGTAGFGALAKTGITTSQFVQQVDYQQALEGQLATTIESIQGVKGAKVVLSIPNQSPFAVAPTAKPRASVLLDLAAGTQLSPLQVRGIVHLVSSAVPGLAASGVTVVDNHGTVLSNSSGAVAASEHQQQEDAYDATLAAQVRQMLERVVGPGNAAVAVHAVLDFNKVTTTTKSVQTAPNGTAVTAPVSTSTSKETFTGTMTPPTGVLGAGNPPAGLAQNGNYAKTTTSTQSKVGTVTQTDTRAPGQVKHFSVAVVLNSAAAKGVSTAQVTSLVSAATGLQAAKGDTISVTKLPFSTTAAAQAAAAAKAAAAARKKAELEHLAEGGALVLLMLILLLLALRAAKRRANQVEEIPLAELPEMRPSMPPVAAFAEPPTTQLPAASDQLHGDIDQFIDNHPDEIARLLRNWANERRRPERSASR